MSNINGKELFNKINAKHGNDVLTNYAENDNGFSFERIAAPNSNDIEVFWQDNEWLWSMPKDTPELIANMVKEFTNQAT